LCQLPATVLDDRIYAGGDHRLDLAPQFYPVRNTQYRSPSQPIGHTCSIDATDKFANSAVFLRIYFLADVTVGGIAGNWRLLLYEMDEYLSCC
jgi:hypothetical protein